MSASEQNNSDTMYNIGLLKDVYEVMRQLWQWDDKDDKFVASQFEYMENDGYAKYDPAQEGIPIALAFEENTFLGIITPIMRFGFRFAMLYKNEYIDSLKQRATELFGAVEIPDGKRFSTIVWHYPQVYGLTRLPWKAGALPPFVTTDNRDERIPQNVGERIFNDWCAYIEYPDRYAIKAEVVETKEEKGAFSNFFRWLTSCFRKQ